MKCTISAFLVLTVLWSAYDSKSQSFDSTFHSDGILEANLVEGKSNSTIRVVSGNIIVGGEKYGGYFPGKLFFFNQDGSVDSASGNNGNVECYNHSSVFVRQLVKDTFLVLGEFILPGSTKAYYYTRIVKMLRNGQLVSGFGNNGVAELCSDCRPNALGMTNDGNFLIGMSDRYGGGDFISKIHPDGSRDTSFGINGNLLLSTALYDFYIQEFHFPSNTNKILITGTHRLPNGTSQGAALQLFYNGIIDSTYGVNGWVMIGNGYPTCSYLQKDNFLIIGGGGIIGSGANSTAIRLKPNGQLDSTFGSNGHYQNNYTGYTMDWFNDICEDSTHNLFFLGTSKDTSTGIREAHLSKLTNGKIDSSFGQNGYFPVSIGNYFLNTILSFDYEKLLISGEAINGSNRYLSLMQIKYKSNPFIEQLTPARYCSGDTAKLYCHSIASSITWYRNNLLLSDTTKGLNTTISGSYYAVGVYQGRTDTSNIVNVVFNPLPQPIVYLQSGYVNTDSFISYQWKDSIGNALSGETARSFYPSASGYYSVEVVDSNGCKNSSAPIYFSYAASVKNISAGRFYLYPNPVKDILFWELEYLDNAQQVFIIDLQGRVLMKADARTGQLDLKNLHPGVYIFKYNHSTHLFSKMD